MGFIMTAKPYTKTRSKSTKEESPLEILLAQQMKFAGLPEPEREYRFAPPRRYRADFAYPDKMILIEVEGGVWTNGAHVRGKHYTSDCSKYNLAATMGFRVLRFTGEMIKSGLALRTIEEVLNEKQSDLQKTFEYQKQGKQTRQN
jgi:very-short-patch-repair endonuclease